MPCTVCCAAPCNCGNPPAVITQSRTRFQVVSSSANANRAIACSNICCRADPTATTNGSTIRDVCCMCKCCAVQTAQCCAVQTAHPLGAQGVFVADTRASRMLFVPQPTFTATFTAARAPARTAPTSARLPPSRVGHSSAHKSKPPTRTSKPPTCTRTHHATATHLC